MINRFRMVAGPNGSGKSTLATWLARDLPQWFKKSEIVKKVQL